MESMGNFTFTLYEVFGYVFPGGIAFLAFIILYWAFVVPCVPLGIATFQPGLVTWVSVVAASYVLGHASQAVGNMIFHGAENSALASETGTAPSWMRQRAQEEAGEILKVNSSELDPRWVFRTLDEYALQTGKDGDRDMFVYREGFYRGTAVSLFFLSATLLVRLLSPGASIRFTKWVFNVSWIELLATAIIVGGVGYMFVRRYRRFAEYRITRAILAALVIRKAVVDQTSVAPSSGPTSSNPSQGPQTGKTEGNGKTTLP